MGIKVEAKEYSIGLRSESKLVEAKLLSSIQPEIPEELKEEGCKCTCTARFHICADGKHHVKLLESSGNEQVDNIVIDALQKWKFKPASVDGQAIASTKKIKVELEVE